MIVLVAVGFVGAHPAVAEQSLIDGTQPADGQTVATPPTVLLLVFSEPLESAPVLTLLEQATGLPVALGAAAQGDSADQWIVPINTPLNLGQYKATWIAGVVTGSYVFTVGTVAADAAPAVAPAATLVDGSPDPAAATQTTVAGAAPTAGADAGATGSAATAAGASGPTAGLAGAVGRFMSAMGIAALIGALVLIVAAWPEGVEYTLTITYLRMVWVVAVIGTVMLVVAERAVLEGDSFAGSLSPTSWSDLASTTPGKALLARLLFVAASGWVAFNPERAIDAATQMPAAAAPVITLLTFGFVHPIGSGLGALVVPAGIIHAASMSVWFGGLALLVRVVLAGPGDEDLIHAIRGFSRVAAPALIGVFFSGVLMLSQTVGGLSGLFGSGFGRLLILKAVAFVVMMRVAIQNRATVAKRLARAGGLGPNAAERLRRAIGTEALAGVVVLGLTATMFTQSPEGIEASLPGRVSTKAAKPTKVAELAFQGVVKVSVGVGPAKAGLNDLTITISEPVSGLVDMTLLLVGPGGARWDIEVPVSPPMTGKGTLPILGVPLCASGTWIVKMSGQSTELKFPDINGTFEVSAVDKELPAVCSFETASTPELPVPPGQELPVDAGTGTTLPPG
jgi:copper transport protein